MLGFAFLLGFVLALSAGIGTGMIPAIQTEAELERLRNEPCYRKYEAAPRVPENQPSWNKTICIWEKYAQRLYKDYLQLAHYERAFQLMKNEAAVRDIAETRNGLMREMQRMPFRSQSLETGGAGGWARLYVCRIQDYVSTATFREHVDQIAEIEKRLGDYEKSAKDFLARLNERGVDAVAPTGVQDYGVFQGGHDLLVGQQQSLGQLRKCDLKGWGKNCEPVGAATLVLKSPQFETFEGARKWFCDQMIWKTVMKKDKPNEVDEWQSSPHTVALTGGRDRTALFKFSGNEWLTIQNAPTCSAPGSSGSDAATQSPQKPVGAASWPIPECGAQAQK
jgi:hypothetical protein